LAPSQKILRLTGVPCWLRVCFKLDSRSRGFVRPTWKLCTASSNTIKEWNRSGVVATKV